jgi:hypothetical protein
VQRVAWAVMGALVLGALLGLFGQGPLSGATADDPSLPLRVEYDRFGRYQSPLTLRIRFTPPAERPGPIFLWLSRDYLRHVQIQRITPEPRTQHLAPTGVSYEFLLREPSSDLEVIFHLEAQAIGLLPGRVGFTEAQSLRFTQWIHP